MLGDTDTDAILVPNCALLFFLEKTAELDWLGCYSEWGLLENVWKSSTFLFGLRVSHNFHVLGLCHTLPFGQQTMTRSPFCLCLLRPSPCLPQGTRRSKMKRLCFFLGGGRSNSRQKSRFFQGFTIITVSNSTSRHFYHLSLSFHLISFHLNHVESWEEPIFWSLPRDWKSLCGAAKRIMKINWMILLSEFHRDLTWSHVTWWFNMGIPPEPTNTWGWNIAIHPYHCWPKMIQLSNIYISEDLV